MVFLVCCLCASTFAAELPLPFTLKESTPLDPQMKSPTGVAFDAQNRLYVAGETGVKVFDKEGRLAREMKTSAPARCVALGEDGEVYAALDAKIEKLDASGKREASWGRAGIGEGEFTSITGIAVRGAHVCVADGGARRLTREAVNGDYIDMLGKFIAPSAHLDCAFDKEGFLWVAHSGKLRVEKYDEDWQLLAYWGKSGTDPDKFCGCCNPCNLAVFPDGRVATYEKGIPRLKVYDAAGNLLAHLGQEAFPADAEEMDLAVDSLGRIAGAEAKTGKVRLFELEAAK
ncbi:MAG: NHL repeat-containing protein [Candidatus Sumerlaeota bacterium]|nr:NHL repeat-containing protein [Candidatus Sumerlaeota bacterium]